jgi:hypothetical protein
MRKREEYWESEMGKVHVAEDKSIQNFGRKT